MTARRAPLLWLAPALLLVVLLVYLADAAGAIYAFTDSSGGAGTKYIGLRNFRDIFHDPVSRSALSHTVVLAAGFVVLSNVIGLGLALALRRTLKTRNFLRSAFFLPVVMSPLAVSYIWQYLFGYDGAINSALGGHRNWLGSPSYALWSILAVMVWQFAGLAMIFYLAGLQGIPEELEEASAVDGASATYRFRRIILPLLAPAVTVSLTFTLVFGLRVFDTVIGLTGGGPADSTETLATQVYKQTWVDGRFGYGAALSLLLSVLVAVVAVIQLVVLRRREERI
jgi:raffinose/stachyose/melibiose transport system permease protein